MQPPCIVCIQRMQLVLWELFTACNRAQCTRRITRPQRLFSASVLLHVDRLSSLIHGRLLSSPSGSSCEAGLLPQLVRLLLQIFFLFDLNIQFIKSCCYRQSYIYKFVPSLLLAANKPRGDQGRRVDVVVQV